MPDSNWNEVDDEMVEEDCVGPDPGSGVAVELGEDAGIRWGN